MKILSKLDNTGMIDEVTDKRYVTDAEKSTWNGKADKTYVDNKVKTDVPVGAKFTDTVTTINGKTGAIAKADITALGIPAQDTTYGTAKPLYTGLMGSYLFYPHPEFERIDANRVHDATYDLTVTQSIAKLDVDKANKTQVLTDVPVGAKFTDTITTINGKTGTIAKADIVALGIPAQDTVVDISDKADKTYVDSQDELKADKAYVDNKVKTDVPANAKFTDTVYTHPTTAGNKHIPTGGASGQVLKYSASGTAIWGADNDTVTTINGKTGAIAKADIVALGIPAQDTVYTHPTTHSVSEVSGLQTALDGKVDDSQVLTNVPLNAKFTDTVYSHPSSHPASMITESSTKRFVSDSEKSTWNSKPDTDTVTTINGKTGAISKADIVALGIPASDTNTTYTEITTAEIDAGTASTRRTISGRRLKYLLDKIVALFPTKTSELTNDSGFLTSVTKSDVGLSNVTNVEQASKTEFDGHNNDATRHITNSERVSWNLSVAFLDNMIQEILPELLPISGGVLENYREKLVTLSGTSTTINLSLANVFTHSLTGNTTYSITNAVSGQAHSFTLIVNIGSTVRTLTFPASVRWQGGEIPDMTTANKIYILTFMTINGGTNWLGMSGGEF